MRMLALPLVLIASVWLANITGNPPAPRAPEIPGSFSLSRASATLAEISRAPHATGSAEHARVRAILVERLKSYGLTVSVQNSFGISQFARWGNNIAAAPIANIVAVLPGRDPATPAVALMAHYDAVPYSHGAGDDGSGTVSLLETARILAAGPKPARDVIFLLTDAEELGLIGAQTFFNEHPLAKHIGAVVNVEARGSRGRATMFQTSTGNAGLISLWAGAANKPSGNSMAGTINQLLPNDTDLSVALNAGKIGINAAFIDGQFDYHAPSDDFANIDQGTLQSLGDFALTTTRALAMAQDLPARGGESTYFDILGQFVVHYPAMLGWGLMLLGLIGLWRMRAVTVAGGWRYGLGGFAWIVAIMDVAGAACHMLGKLLYGEGSIAEREQLAETGAAFWMYLALCLGIMLLARPRMASWIGALWLLLLAGLATQIFLPAANWEFAWPLLGAVIIGWAVNRYGRDSRAALWMTIGIGGLIFAMSFQLISLFHVSVGTIEPGVIALVVPFLIVTLGPILLPWTEASTGRYVGAGLVLCAGMGALWLGQTDGFSARQPRPGDLFHLTNADNGKTYWATTSTRAELPPGKASEVDVSNWRALWAVPAPAADVPRPAFAFTQAGARGMLHITTANVQRRFSMAFRPSAALGDVRLNGKPVRLAPQQWTKLSFGADVPVDLTLEFDATIPGTMEYDYRTAVDGLPPSAPQPTALPTNWTLYSGSRMVTGSARLAWK